MAEIPPFDFDANGEPIAQRVSTGLAKISLALKTHAWRGASSAGLTPTQGQALVLLRAAPQGMRLDRLARDLGVTAPTASDAVSALVAKGLVVRGRSTDNHRAVALTLTPEGKDLADKAADWPDFLMRALGALDQGEQAGFLRALIKIIRSLQEAGDIPIQRMCVSCRYFRPYSHVDFEKPHHCAFVNAPMGDRNLRIDCAEQEAAAPAEAEARWARWSTFLANPSAFLNEGDLK